MVIWKDETFQKHHTDERNHNSTYLWFICSFFKSKTGLTFEKSWIYVQREREA